MSDVKTISLNQSKPFILKFVLILLFVQIVNNTLIYFSVNVLFPNPGIPKHRLISAGTEIITLLIFLFLVKPSMLELGLSWSDIKKSWKRMYIIGCSFILLLVVTSYFIMYDIRYFALATNINFGITTPILEELIFRGYAWTKFREEGFSSFKVLAITSLLFGFYHLGYYFQIAYATSFHPEAPSMIEIMITKIAFTIILGFIFGMIRWKTNKVYGSVILHAFLNIMGK